MRAVKISIICFVISCALLCSTRGVWGQGTAAPVRDAMERRLHTETGLVRVNDIAVSYRVVGNGEAIILITGYGATMDLWDPYVIRELSSRFKVIVFDNRGIGRTTAGDKPFTIELFAEDTVGLMDALRIKKAHILGWSMGAFIALDLALKHPERVGKMILFAGNCHWRGKEVVEASPDVMEKLMDLSGTPEERGGRLISILFPKKWLDDHPKFLSSLPRNKVALSQAVLERQGQAINAWAGVCGKMDNINLPTLFITGTEDVVIPPDNSLLMASRIQGSWLIRIPGGHSAMYQYPKTFFRGIHAFLEGEK